GNEGQIVIYGEAGHAEVNGLVGQTNQKAIIVKTEEDLEKVNFDLPIRFFSQTTKSTAGFEKMEQMIQERIIKSKGSLEEGDFITNDTLCRQVSNREPQLQRFAKAHDVILFVSGKKSSNGKALYSVCQANNPHSYFISDSTEIQPEWLEGVETVGICGATSTPMWLMEKVAAYLGNEGAEVDMREGIAR
ncbi:MAG: 4-hydroxy-3-methylbut-2-enyl diphosphate reductase, partial [Bacteroidota bacterium]